MNLRPRALPVVLVDEDAFCADQGESALESVRVASVLGILAFVTFAFVDTFIAPGQLQLLFEVRAGVIAVLLGVLAATFLSGPTILARRMDDSIPEDTELGKQSLPGLVLSRHVRSMP